MTITIAKLLDRQEYDVRFVVIGRQIGEIKEFVPEDYPLTLVKIRNIFDFTTLRVYCLLRRMRPNYVFCSLMYLNPRVIQAAKWVGHCKVIVRFNCAVNRVYGFTKFLTQTTYPKADIIIAQTEKMQDDLERTYHLKKGKVVAMHNMIDQASISEKLFGTENPYKDETNKIFVWVGRFDPVKRAEDVVRAFILACQKNGRFSLYMVGKYNEENDYYKQVKAVAIESGFEKKIHFMGFQTNPYKWMKYANCFILSSSTEASPNALFEALYLGVPSVATRCTPNIDDIIEDGINGYKVDVGNIEAMSEKMLDALKLKEVKPIYHHSAPDDFIKLFH